MPSPTDIALWDEDWKHELELSMEHDDYELPSSLAMSDEILEDSMELFDAITAEF